MCFNTIYKQGLVSVKQADPFISFEQLRELLTTYKSITVDENGYIRAFGGHSVDIEGQPEATTPKGCPNIGIYKNVF